MRTAPKQDFLTILHLAEQYQDQYRERNLCLSPEQNDVFFRDFVGQYYSAIYQAFTQELFHIVRIGNR